MSELQTPESEGKLYTQHLEIFEPLNNSGITVSVTRIGRHVHNAGDLKPPAQAQRQRVSGS
jgi:hypothetical protein